MEQGTKPSAVRIPRGIPVAMAGALLMCLTALAYFVGRESAHKEPASSAPLVVAPISPLPVTPAEATATAESPLPTETPEAVAGPIVPGATPVSGAWTPPLQPTAPAQPAAQEPPPPAAPDTAVRDEVARYFEQVESIQSQGKYWSDPQALAKALMDQAGKGDSSGFDKLLETNRRVRDELRGLQVPAPCAEHHRLTLALVEDGMSLLSQVRDSAMNPTQDMGALNAYATGGRELEARAKEVDALAARIKQQFGIGG